jgi:hypothetical protein
VSNGSGPIVNIKFRWKCHETRLAMTGLFYEHQPMMSDGLPAQLRVWVECPRCGCTDELTRDFRLPKGEAGPLLEKIAPACERCGESAYMYLQRTVSNIH